jgi:hypothetical protein
MVEAGEEEAQVTVVTAVRFRKFGRWINGAFVEVSRHASIAAVVC